MLWLRSSIRPLQSVSFGESLNMRARIRAGIVGCGNIASIEALLDRGVDVVSVCTPHPTHEAVVTAAHEACTFCARSRSQSTCRPPAG
jgi:hypothetical protein